MRLGPYTVTLHDHGPFRLDGGAMFGAVPRTIWERLCPPDERNRIPMATRSLVVEDGAGSKLLVDLGCGDKYSPKMREIFCIPDAPYLPVEGVTDVLLTHLHFDHCGGISRFEHESPSEEPSAANHESQIANRAVPSYPRARHFVSRANLENAKNPNPRERASYLEENVGALESVETVLIREDSQELPGWPGLRVHRSDGHTRGLLWVELSGGGASLAYPSDLCPTSHHLPPVYAMGYDMCAETSMRERQEFLERAIEGNWTVVFQHDPAVPAARLKWDDRGRPAVGERVEV